MIKIVYPLLSLAIKSYKILCYVFQMWKITPTVVRSEYCFYYWQRSGLVNFMSLTIKLIQARIIWDDILK